MLAMRNESRLLTSVVLTALMVIALVATIAAEGAAEDNRFNLC